MKKFIIGLVFLSGVLQADRSTLPFVKAVNDQFVKIQLTAQAEKLYKFLTLVSLMAENKSLFYFDGTTAYLHKSLYNKLIQAHLFLLESHTYPSKKEIFFKKIGYVQAEAGENSQQTIYLDMGKINLDL